MEKTAYAGLNVTIRVLENDLLAPADYNTMLQASSLADALNVLRKSEYHIPDDIEQTKNFDQFLMARLREVYDDLYEATPDRRVIDFYALRYEYHNLKVLFKEWYAEKDFKAMYIPIGRHSIESLRSAVRTGAGDGMDHAMLQGIQDVRQHFETHHSYDAIAIILDSAYLDNMRELADGIADPEVTAFTDTVINFENLAMLIRAMHQERPAAFIRSVLSDHGTIPVDELSQYATEKNYAAIAESFKRTRLGAGLEDVLKTDENTDVVDLEAKIEELLAEEMQGAQLKAFGPLPTIAYLYYLENEITNVRLILVGLDNNLDHEAIEERMRPIYGS